MNDSYKCAVTQIGMLEASWCPFWFIDAGFPRVGPEPLVTGGMGYIFQLTGVARRFVGLTAQHIRPLWLHQYVDPAI